MNASFYRSQIKCHARIAGRIYGKFDLILVASTFVHYQGEVCSYPDVSADADYVVSLYANKIPGRKEVQEQGEFERENKSSSDSRLYVYLVLVLMKLYVIVELSCSRCSEIETYVLWHPKCNPSGVISVNIWRRHPENPGLRVYA